MRRAEARHKAKRTDPEVPVEDLQVWRRLMDEALSRTEEERRYSLRERVYVRVSLQEKAMLEDEAKRHGVTVSDLMVARALGLAVRPSQRK